MFNQNELAFVIAHELAHLFYKHSYIDSTYGFLYPQEGEKRCPLLLFNSYLFWQKLAEISADRLALFLIGDLETSIRAIVKLSSGLADKHLKLNISSIIDFAVENFKDMNANQMEYFANKMNTEHPANPMRIVALNRFYNSGVMKRILEGSQNEERDCLLDGLDEELTEKLERYPANEEESILLFFVIAAGIMIMNACEGFSENGFYYLSNFASNYYLFSMDLIQNMMEDKNLQETMEENAKIIREKYPELKYHIVAILVELMLSDKRITDEGEKMLTDIALEHLQFDPRALNDILVEKLKFFFRPFEE